MTSKSRPPTPEDNIDEINVEPTKQNVTQLAKEASQGGIWTEDNVGVPIATWSGEAVRAPKSTSTASLAKNTREKERKDLLVDAKIDKDTIQAIAQSVTETILRQSGSGGKSLADLIASQINMKVDEIKHWVTDVLAAQEQKTTAEYISEKGAELSRLTMLEEKLSDLARNLANDQKAQLEVVNEAIEVLRVHREQGDAESRVSEKLDRQEQERNALLAKIRDLELLASRERRGPTSPIQERAAGLAQKGAKGLMKKRGF